MRLTNFKKLFLSLISLVMVFPSFSYVHKPYNTELYEFVSEEYGLKVSARLRLFEQLIIEDEEKDIFSNLRDVNNFFNQVTWVSDSLHWGKKDYWQTPMETLIEFRGDCEDIAIAKYTALRIMGIPEKNLALVYSFIEKQPHMVLAYYPDYEAEPFILDSYNKELKKSTERKDIVSVYEFNSMSVWLTDTQFLKKSTAHPSHLALVDELKQRIENNRNLLRTHNKGEPTVPFSFDVL